MNIKDLPLSERPRERLIALGPTALTEAELLAILIGSGNAGETAVQLCQRLLADCGGSLKRVGQLSLSDITQSYKGLGPAKAVAIMAAVELGRRRMMESAAEKQTIATTADVYDIMLPRMADLQHEEVYALYLRTDHSLIGQPHLVSRGAIDSAVCDVRMVLREALMRQATALILCHNHPSGNTRPSTADDRLTDRLRRAAEVMDIRLLDHVIIADGATYSYSEMGKL